MSQPTPTFEFPTPSAEPEASAIPATPADPTPQDSATPAAPLNGATPSTDPSTDVDWETFVAKHTKGKEYDENAPAPSVVESSRQDPELLQTPQGTDAQVPEAEPDLQQQLTALSHQFGLDLTGFSSVNDAIAAARLNIANSLVTPASQATTEQQRVQQAVEETPSAFDLDLENIHDETLVKNLQTVKQQFEAMSQKVNELEQERQQERIARHNQTVQALHQRADAVVDKANPTRYGTSKSRNPVQQIAYQNLMNTAGQLIQRYKAVGQVPVVEDVVHQALVLLDGHVPSQSVQQPAQNLPPGPAPAATSRPLPTIPQSAPGTKFGPNDFDKDPSFMRALKHIR